MGLLVNSQRPGGPSEIYSVAPLASNTLTASSRPAPWSPGQLDCNSSAVQTLSFENKGTGPRLGVPEPR